MLCVKKILELVVCTTCVQIFLTLLQTTFSMCTRMSLVLVLVKPVSHLQILPCITALAPTPGMVMPTFAKHSQILPYVTTLYPPASLFWRLNTFPNSTLSEIQYFIAS